MDNNQVYTQELIDCDFLGTEDAAFTEFVRLLPKDHWSQYDLSAVRLGWEAHKKLSQNKE